MNGWFVFGIVAALAAFVWGWCLVILSVDPDRDEIERYEQQVAWFESVFE